ncbi:MAG: hypothetical protein EOP04_19840 [Proteobacteria bacterium]|nr:MAG: hypothetical protein EOP04_19840 [Pseudomonadota bacterium]
MAGLWPRPCLVARMIWPEKHQLNMWLCYTALVLTVIGTVGETVVAMYLYGINFAGWSTAVQWSTPISHVVFVVAQGCSSRIMFILGKRHQRALKQLVATDKEIDRISTSATDGQQVIC